MKDEVPAELQAITDKLRAQAPILGLGYKKSRLEDHLFDRLQSHFFDSIDKFAQEQHVSFLQSDTGEIHPSLVYIDEAFNRELLQQLQSRHEEWAGRKLKLSGCFGPRIYTRGSFLYLHTDRPETHIVSSTITIAREVDEPWPFRIEDHAGEIHDMIIEPGEMVFYEGAYLRHGRPQPLNGNYFANIFVHYAPVE